jgi:hypothetical protein
MIRWSRGLTTRATAAQLLIYPAPGLGVTMNDIALAMGPDALRGPGGPLPADPDEDAKLSPELLALKQAADDARRAAER